MSLTVLYTSEHLWFSSQIISQKRKPTKNLFKINHNSLPNSFILWSEFSLNPKCWPWPQQCQGANRYTYKSKVSVLFIVYLAKKCYSSNSYVTNIKRYHLENLAWRLFSHTTAPVKAFKTMWEKQARGMTVNNQIPSTVCSWSKNF